MTKLYVSLPKRYDKEEIVLVRVACKKRQRAIKFKWIKEIEGTKE